jgi:hypothetical protein
MQINDTLWIIDKELSIAPALDIIFRFKRNTELGEFFDCLFPLLLNLEAFPFSNEQSISVLSHDKDQGGWPGAMTPELWLKILAEMKAAAVRKIRKKQTVFKICAVEALTSNYIDDLCISLSQNNFPDQACVVSVQLSTSRTDAWEHLKYVRDNITTAMSSRFFWASLGYRFVMNPFAQKSAVEMQVSCMRYLGADLQDIVCVQNGWWWNKLRTVNWQTTINYADPVKDGWDVLPDIVTFMTGEHPSVCDRNNIEPDNMNVFQEYKSLSSKLSPFILETDEMVWSVDWDPDIYARWAKRWNEINI